MREHHDDFRRMLLFEPRGHADMYGALLGPPVSPGADFGVLFLTNEGYSTMCGHGIIALTTALIEAGHVSVGSGSSACITYDTPAGLVKATATIERGDVIGVAFENVPAFRLARQLPVVLDDGRTVAVDLVWGGAFYALVPATALNVALKRDSIGRLIEAGMDVKRAVTRATTVEHPLDPSLNGLYGTIMTDEPMGDADGRNIVIFADGEVDRSPCGTGTSARLAALYADGDIGLNQPYRHESITGSVFAGRVISDARFGGFPAVVTEISGRGFVTGFHHFVMHPDDPFQTGFLLGR